MLPDNASIARVELLRRQRSCAAWVLRALNLGGRLTVPQLARVLRGRWRESTIRAALCRLRLAGYARKTQYYHRRARRWESC
jgi:hypothetical protein